MTEIRVDAHCAYVPDATTLGSEPSSLPGLLTSGDRKGCASRAVGEGPMVMLLMSAKEYGLLSTPGLITVESNDKLCVESHLLRSAVGVN